MRKTTAKVKISKNKIPALKWPKFTFRNVVVFSLVAAPIILLICLVKHYAVNVPFWDSWELVDLFKKSHEGVLGFSDFFAQHNEHRILFPRLVMYSLAQVTRWNVNYELVVSLVLAVLSFILLLKILKKTVANKQLFAVGAILLSLIFFSPLQWENWMWGWQIQWFMNVLGIVVAVWALSSWERPVRKKLVVATIASVVATYSLASGMFVWFVCLPLFYFRKDLKKYTPYWLLAGALTVGSHYIHYVNPAYHPSKTLFLHQPVRFIEYLVVYLARPINFDFLLSAHFAIALLVISGSLSTYLLYKKRMELYGPLLPWLCLIAYGLIAAGTTGISRLGFGVSQAYANRYVTISNLCLIGLVVMILRTYEITNHTNMLAKIVKGGSIVVLTIGSLLVLLNYTKGVEQMRQQNRHLLKAKQCTQQATSEADDCLLFLYPNKPTVWKRLKYLRSVHWGGL